MMPYRIPLANPTFEPDGPEVQEALQAMRERKVTMGERTFRAEEMWSRWLGVKHTILVNSGSMANLLALAALRERLPKNPRTATPALTWATTVFPLVQNGYYPIFFDSSLGTLCIDEKEVVRARGGLELIMPVHFLGQPCDMDELTSAGPPILEDACEAPGAEWRGRKIGTFGVASTFSFYFSHHLTMMEGGAVCTDDEELAEIVRSLRSFGNIRYLKQREKIAAENPLFDPRHIFLRVGYNAKPTDVQAAFLLHQIPKLDAMIAERRSNAEYWIRKLGHHEELMFVREMPPERNSRMGFPVLVAPGAPFRKDELVAFLEANGIETRQLEVGNIVEQPVAKRFAWGLRGRLRNAEYALRNGFFIGCNRLAPEDLDYVVGKFEEFLRGRRGAPSKNRTLGRRK